MMPGTIMGDTDIVIRAAIPGDAAALGLLAAELGYPNTAADSADRLRRVLESESHAVLVAETAQLAIIGWVHVFGTVRVASDAFAELGGLVVAESSRGRGVGAQLVASADRWALDNGYHKLRIRSRVERSEAHGFFERLGFVGRKTQKVFERPLAGDQ
jgi:GNAT superfamily N-acetyltransferase